ncbi:MAG: PLDc N-terminal domain-containing protein [Chitinispirillaceae bacterium]
MKEKWKDMPGWKKVFFVMMGIIQIALLAAALLDIRKRSAEDIRGSKKLWTMLSFINFIGPLLYFKCGRKSEGVFKDCR